MRPTVELYWYSAESRDCHLAGLLLVTFVDTQTNEEGIVQIYLLELLSREPHDKDFTVNLSTARLKRSSSTQLIERHSIAKLPALVI